MSSPSGGSPLGPQPNAWWDHSAEQRLNFVTSRLAEVTASLSEVAKELRAQTRTSDIQAGALERVNERLRDCEKALDTLPTRLERLASVDWMQRLDTRLGAIEDENKSPFVRKTEHEPVRKAVFTLIGAICLAVLGAVAKLIMK